MYWLIGLGLGLGTAGYYAKKQYEKKRQKTWREGYDYGYDRGLDSGKSIQKRIEEENSKHYKDFVFDESGLDSADSRVRAFTQCRAKIAEIKETLNALCKRDEDIQNHLTHLDMLYNGLFLCRKPRVLLGWVACFPMRSKEPRPLQFALAKAFRGDDTQLLGVLDMAYRILRDEYLLDVSDDEPIKEQMDSWYLAQRERYLRACLVREEHYACDLGQTWVYVLCSSAKAMKRESSGDSGGENLGGKDCDFEKYLEAMIKQLERYESNARSFWDDEINAELSPTNKHNAAGVKWMYIPYSPPSAWDIHYDKRLWLGNWAVIFHGIWLGKSMREIIDAGLERSKQAWAQSAVKWSEWHDDGRESPQDRLRSGYESWVSWDSGVKVWFDTYLKTRKLDTESLEKCKNDHNTNT